jgi:hypothetical protein
MVPRPTGWLIGQEKESEGRERREGKGERRRAGKRKDEKRGNMTTRN